MKKASDGVQSRRPPRSLRLPLRIAGAPTKAVDTAEVHERIWSAIMDHNQ